MAVATTWCSRIGFAPGDKSARPFARGRGDGATRSATSRAFVTFGAVSLNGEASRGATSRARPFDPRHHRPVYNRASSGGRRRDACRSDVARGPRRRRDRDRRGEGANMGVNRGVRRSRRRRPLAAPQHHLPERSGRVRVHRAHGSLLRAHAAAPARGSRQVPHTLSRWQAPFEAFFNAWPEATR